MKDIYTKPFTYLIGWSKLNKWYYGVKYSRGAQPKDLWTTYFTSSKYVKVIRDEYGEPDVIQIRKVFDDQEKAREWESIVLKRMKVRIDERFLNKTDNKTYSDKPDDFGEITSKVQKGLFKNDKNYRNKFKSLGRKVGLWNKGKPKSDQWKKAASAGMKGKHKGKRWCNKDGINQRVPQDRYDELLAEGWSPGRSWSDESRQKLRGNGLSHKNNLTNYFPPADGVK